MSQLTITSTRANCDEIRMYLYHHKISATIFPNHSVLCKDGECQIFKGCTINLYDKPSDKFLHNINKEFHISVVNISKLPNIFHNKSI